MKHYGLDENGKLIASDEIIIPQRVWDDGEPVNEPPTNEERQALIWTYFDFCYYDLNCRLEMIEHKIRTDKLLWNTEEACIFIANLIKDTMS